MSFLDVFLADRLVKADSIEDNLGQNIDTPYVPQLNKELPKSLIKDKDMPKNVMDFPEVPEEARSLVNGFISDLKRAEELAAELSKLQKELQELLKPKREEANQLSTEIGAKAQDVGKLISEIEPDVDLVIARLKDMFVATKISSAPKSMPDTQQVDLLKQLMLTLHPKFGKEVLIEFEAAKSKFSEVNLVISKTLRVWPIPQNRIKGSIKTLVAQLGHGIIEMLAIIEEHISNGLIGLNEIFNDVEEAEAKHKVVPMNAEPMSLAAQKRDY